MQKSFQKLIPALFSGVLLTLPWYESFSGLFLLVALVPLLVLENEYIASKTSKGLFWYSVVSFFVWNVSTTWWIANATYFGMAFAIIVNTFLYAIVFYLFHVTRKRAGNWMGYISLVAYWTGFEYFYLNAEISWPWLNLGNGFAHNVQLIQWYEYTGTLGGTLWVLISNILAAVAMLYFMRKHSFNSVLRRILLLISLIITIPLVFSLIKYRNYEETKDSCNVVVVQPNIDPYNDKFGGLSPEKQLKIILNTADSLRNDSIDYYVGPETAIQEHIWETELGRNWSVFMLREFLRNSIQSHFVIGAETVKEYKPGEKLSATARRFRDANVYYDSYNTALQIDRSPDIQVYHKSKLVVGVEKMPYANYLKFMEKFAIKLGGTFGSLGSQDERSVFFSQNRKFTVAPVICYESVYGAFVDEYIRKGATLIFIITNDGWWGNTPGHRQHLNYARLRAVETRRSIARSANTGVSAFINQRGDIVQSLGWWKRGALTASINANDRLTFYVKHGDYLGRFALIISGISVLFLLIQFFRRRNEKINS